MGNKSKMYVKLESSNDEVTGSCFRLLATLPNKKEINFLVDCGKFQGNNQEKFNEKLPFDPRNYDFVLLTHNHMDHMGRLPQLFNKGYNKKVYTTTLNKYLLKPALDDAYKVEENNAKHLKNGMTFTTSDITSVIENTKGCKYMKAYQPHKNVNVIFYENGHLPGSAYISVEIFFEGYKSIFLLFSGDYKKYNMLYLTDNIPEEIKDIPFTIIQESTYGKSDSFEKKSCIKRNIIDTIKNGGSVVIPSFAQGRYDEIAYILKCMQDDNLLDKSIPIGFDGKLPKRYWYIRKKHPELYHYICDDILPSNIVEISKENRESFIHSSGSKIIVTTSGMATYGPAPTYIKHFLKQKNSLIQFAGYTAINSLGRRLIETEYGQEVNVFGEDIIKLARVECTKELTAHSYRDELVELLNNFTNIKSLFITHGEPDVKVKYRDYVTKNTNLSKYDIQILNKNSCHYINCDGIIL